MSDIYISPTRDEKIKRFTEGRNYDNLITKTDFDGQDSLKYLTIIQDLLADQQKDPSIEAWDVDFEEDEWLDMIYENDGIKGVEFYFDVKDNLNITSWSDQIPEGEAGKDIEPELLEHFDTFTYTSRLDGTVFDDYLEGINYDINLQSAKLDGAEQAFLTFTNKNPDFNEFYQAYSRLRNRLPDSYKGGKLHTMMDHQGTKFLMDSWSLEHILGAYHQLHTGATPHNAWYEGDIGKAFSKVDDWNIYDDDPDNNRIHHYFHMDDKFMKAYERYADEVYDQGGGFWSYIKFFGAWYGTDDDLFNSSTQKERWQKVKDKYKDHGWENEQLIFDLWKAADREFMRVYTTLQSDIDLMWKYKDKYTQVDDDMDWILALTQRLPRAFGGAMIPGLAGNPTGVENPIDKYKAYKDLELIFYQEQEALNKLWDYKNRVTKGSTYGD